VAQAALCVAVAEEPAGIVAVTVTVLVGVGLAAPGVLFVGLGKRVRVAVGLDIPGKLVVGVREGVRVEVGGAATVPVGAAVNVEVSVGDSVTSTIGCVFVGAGTVEVGTGILISFVMVAILSSISGAKGLSSSNAALITPNPTAGKEVPSGYLL
jgi:hypothetical protein